MEKVKNNTGEPTTLRQVRLFLILLGVFFFINLQSQDTTLLTLDALYSKIKANHPLTFQAALQNTMADAELMKAKGRFDPTLGGSLNQKNFENKEYFSLLNTELKIPTWPGIDIKTGYELNRGVFLGPENSTPNNGLIFGGVSLNLGQGLFIDERRAGVTSAEIMQKFASARQRDLMNELLFNATLVYWDWFRAFNVLEVYKTSLRNAQERFNAVRFNVSSGDRPQIDTVEAKIQIQIIQIGLNQAQLDFTNTSTILSGYFWDADNKNIGLNILQKPALSENELRQNSINFNIPSLADFVNDHPYLEQVRQKSRQLNVDRNLKKDRLKPLLSLQYNPITEAIGSNFLTNYNINNYKWGVEFKMPLLLRKERGDLKLAELKIQENELLLNNKSQELLNKYQAYVNEWRATNEQISIFKETVNLYEQMFIAERRLFEIGESSLFLVNTREQAYINAKIKLTEFIAKNRISYYSIYYFAGKLGDY